MRTFTFIAAFLAAYITITSSTTTTTSLCSLSSKPKTGKFPVKSKNCTSCPDKKISSNIINILKLLNKNHRTNCSVPVLKTINKNSSPMHQDKDSYGEIIIHNPAPIIVKRPPTKLVIKHPPIIVKPPTIIFHQPPSTLSLPPPPPPSSTIPVSSSVMHSRHTVYKSLPQNFNPTQKF